MIVYEQDEELEADDPGNVLRKALQDSIANEPNIDQRVLGQLLYTAEERCMLDDCRILPNLAMTIWRLVELSKTIDKDTLATMRM